MSTVRSTMAEWSRLEVVSSRPARRAIGVGVFVIATALSAKVAVPLPGTPVPFTFQPMLVLLAGALLGARMGALSQSLYLAAGMVGLPVFAAGGGLAYLLGPTGGYLLAYPLAAWLVGALMADAPVRRVGALLAGLGAIYAGGLAWLAVVGTVDAAVALGLRPFVLADLVKVLLAAAVVGRLGGRARELFLR